MRASRLISLLLLLQVRGRMTAQQLADELEVSVRTIYRDVQSLSVAGIPLYGDPGDGGGYRLLDGYRTRLTGLTAGEAEALFLAGLPGAAADLGLGTVMATAELKLQAALPAELRDRAARIRERFHLDAPGWYQDGDSSPYLAAVADAVWNQRRIEVRYRRWAEPTDVTRTLEPYGVVLKAGRWYLVARTTGQLRTYRVNQVLGLTTLNEGFERIEDFDLPAYWDASVADFLATLHHGEARIRLSAAGRERLTEMLGPAVAAAVASTVTAADDRGWVTAVVPIESAEHAHAEFLRLGAEIEVLAPADLRDRMRRTARSLGELYRVAQRPREAEQAPG
jgi:predicted DNA-binding transcriptional regulator YafY